MFQPGSIHLLSTFRGSRHTSFYYLIRVFLERLLVVLKRIAGALLSGDLQAVTSICSWSQQNFYKYGEFNFTDKNESDRRRAY
jgi:hypothetical protein